MDNDIKEMEIAFQDCDYLTGKNYDGIKYDECIYCYRYEDCKRYYEKKFIHPQSISVSSQWEILAKINGTQDDVVCRERNVLAD